MQSAPCNYTLRPARREERWTIRWRVLREKLDPTQLDWRRFVVAEGAGGRLLGFAQMKELGDGVREFGSLVVEPDFRRQGIGGALLRHFLDHTPPPVYLLCGTPRVRYYGRFGFHAIHSPDEIPAPLRRKWRAGNFWARLIGVQVAAMVFTDKL